MAAYLMNNRTAITSTVGYMCFALLSWITSMPDAGLVDKMYGHGVAMMLPLGVVLCLMGILAFVNEQVVDAVVFFGGSGFFWVEHVYESTLVPAVVDSGRFSGWYMFVWSVFFFCAWLGSFRAGKARSLFLLGAWMTFLDFAIAEWGSLRVLTSLGGYLGLATAALAVTISALAITGHGLHLADRPPGVGPAGEAR
jgi:uncharacterized protein